MTKILAIIRCKIRIPCTSCRASENSHVFARNYSCGRYAATYDRFSSAAIEIIGDRRMVFLARGSGRERVRKPCKCLLQGFPPFADCSYWSTSDRVLRLWLAVPRIFSKFIDVIVRDDDNLRFGCKDQTRPRYPKCRRNTPSPHPPPPPKKNKTLGNFVAYRNFIALFYYKRPVIKSMRFCDCICNVFKYFFRRQVYSEFNRFWKPTNLFALPHYEIDWK